MTGKDHGLRTGFSPLAGVTAGTAAVLFAFGVLALAWHRVAGQVAAGITVLVYALIAGVCGLVLAALVYVALWLRHRVRYPDTLAPHRPAQAGVLDAEPVPQVLAAGVPPAIESPRVYLNVTPGELAEIMRHHGGEHPGRAVIKPQGDDGGVYQAVLGKERS